FRAAPRYYQYLLALWGLGTLFTVFVVAPLLILPVLGVLDQQKAGSAFAFLLWLVPFAEAALMVAFRVFRLVVLKLDFDKRWYVVTDRSLRVREGVVHVSEMTVTFANIQNLSISQGPIQRALGIADLRVDTAGGGSMSPRHGASQTMHTAWLRGIANAAEVRELIQARVRRLKDSGLGDHEEERGGTRQNFSPATVSALREVLAEARALQNAVRG
ncbi:MAG TPA: PH domain-containing protein, partial [Planctomycetota bacterium]|nr:PH domain-containing protein [Planctomycetota bacterium]